MVIKTFGSEEEIIQTCDSVKFALKSQHDQAEISLSAYAVPMICEPLQHQFTSQVNGDLNLADCSTGSQGCTTQKSMFSLDATSIGIL